MNNYYVVINESNFADFKTIDTETLYMGLVNGGTKICVWFRRTLPLSMYYAIENEKYVYCFSKDNLAAYLRNNEEIKKISLYNTLFITPNGFETTPYTKTLFSIPLTQMNSEMFNQWRYKYTKLIENNLDKLNIQIDGKIEFRTLVDMWINYAENLKGFITFDKTNNGYFFIELLKGNLGYVFTEIKERPTFGENDIVFSHYGIEAFKECTKEHLVEVLDKLTIEEISNNIYPFLDDFILSLKPINYDQFVQTFFLMFASIYYPIPMLWDDGCVYTNPSNLEQMGVEVLKKLGIISEESNNVQE